MDDEKELHHQEEALKLYFDYFKHTTTVGTAAALVVLAVYRGGALRGAGSIIGQSVAGYALVSFGVAVIVGLLGLVISLRLFKEAAATGRGLDGLVTANMALILFGFLVVMSGAVGGAIGGALLAWVGILIVPVLFMFLVFFNRYLSSLVLPPPTQKTGATPEGSEARSVSGGGQGGPEPWPYRYRR